MSHRPRRRRLAVVTAALLTEFTYEVPDTKGSVQLKLTPEQQEQIRKVTGKLTDTLEMSIEELEERIQPAWRW